MDRAHENAHRAHVRALAAQLVPPSSPLVAAVLARPRPLTPLAPGHAERNLDFWDERRVGEWEAGRARDDKWEMTAAQVHELRRARSEYTETVKQVRDECRRAQDFGESWTFPLRLNDEVVLSRKQRLAWHAAVPPSDTRRAHVALVGPKPKHLLPRPDAALLAMDAAPEFDEAFELKLTANAEQVAALKAVRQRFSRKAMLDLAKRDVDDAWREDLAGFEPSAIPRLGSPPIFPRTVSLTSRLEDLHRDPFSGFLPSVGSDLPSSSRGVGISQEQWNTEEGLTPLPSSAQPTSPARQHAFSALCSSSPVKTLVQDIVELDRPVFGRATQAALPMAHGFDVAHLADMLKDDAPGTDQLDMDNETTELERREPDPREALASDDTLGEPPADDGGADDFPPRRIKRTPSLVAPHLPHSDPATLRAAPRLTTRSGALRSAAAPPALAALAAGTAPAPWALEPLRGLRALTLELSWQAWTVPRGETLERVAVGAEDDEAETNVENAEAGRPDEEALDDVSDADLPTWAHNAGSEDDEVVARAWGADDASRGDAHEGTTALTLASRGGSPDAFETLEDVEGAAATPAENRDAASTRLDPLPRSSQVTPDSPAHLPADLPLSPLLAHAATAAPTSDSSDFAFIDPPPLSRHGASSSRCAGWGEAAWDAGSRSTEQAVSPAHAALSSRTLGGPPPPSEMDEPLVPLAKVDPPPPTWSNAAALDRFLVLRGCSTAVPATAPAAPQPAAPPLVTQPTPHRHSSPPPGSIPFPLPAFLADSVDPPYSSPEPIRVVAFDALFQMRAHLAALQQHGLVLVHRTSRLSHAPYETHEPHLIVDPHSGVLFLRLDALVGNAVRADVAEGPRARQEAVFSTLSRLNGRFERLLVVFEEGSHRIGGVRRYAYTPPVLAALAQLAGALDALAGGTHGVQVALSKGSEHSAALVRRWLGYLRAREEREREVEGMPVLEVWGAREWLTDDPSEDEASLLQLADMNELAACVVLGVCAANDFLGLASKDRSAVFAPLLGTDRIVWPVAPSPRHELTFQYTQNRISRLLASHEPASAASQGSSSGGHDAQPLMRISHIAAFGEASRSPSSGGSEDEWTRWIDLNKSQE
ncbi:hypothetical protein JCM3770_005449 [Rhodotorula araucariae]